MSKNWKLFVPCLSGFWLRKMLLGCPEQKMFPAKKNMGGTNGLDPLMIVYTLYGCFLAQQKRDAERAHQKMFAKEKADFKQKMMEIDNGGADNGQSRPPSLTPI